MNQLITIDKRRVCKYVDIPRPKRLNVLDRTLNWLEKEDGPTAKLVAMVLLGFTGLYFIGQIIRYIALISK